MRKHFLLLTALLTGAFLKGNSQEQLLLHNSNHLLYQTDVPAIDSIKFSGNSTSVHQPTGVLQIPNAGIDSMTFATTPPDDIYIIYNGSSVTIINPFSTQGITITANGAQVTATSTSVLSNIRYHLLGQSTNGSLTLSSGQPVQLFLSQLTLTNPAGPAISISGNMTTSLFLSSGTVNTLSDGIASTGNATLLVSSRLTVEGKGKLQIQSLKKHAIASSDTLRLVSGEVEVTGAISDAVHTTCYIQNGGHLTANAMQGDGVDAGTAIQITGGIVNINNAAGDSKGLKSGNVTVDGGDISITASGDQSKAIKAAQQVTINGGNLSLIASGNTALTASGNGYNTTYCSAIGADGNITINGGTIGITLPNTNKGGRGFSADGNILVNGGTLNITTNGDGATYTNANGDVDDYKSYALKANGAISVLAGNITTTSTGTGGSGIAADSGLIIGNPGAADSLLHLSVTTSGERFLVSSSLVTYANPKCIDAGKSLTVNSGYVNVLGQQTQPGSEGFVCGDTLFVKGGVVNANTYDDCLNGEKDIWISGGTHQLTSRANDGTDSNGPIQVSGGFILSNGASMPESGFDCNGNSFTITGGIMLGSGGKTSHPTAPGAAQNALEMNTTAGTTICIKNASNQVVLMYQAPLYSGNPASNAMVVLFSDPAIVNGTYTILHGGTISGGTTAGGYNTGGTYSGGSSQTVVISSPLTTTTL